MTAAVTRLAVMEPVVKETATRTPVMKHPATELHVEKPAAMGYAMKIHATEPAVRQVVMVNVTRQTAVPAATELAVMGSAVPSLVTSSAVRETVNR